MMNNKNQLPESEGILSRSDKLRALGSWSMLAIMGIGLGIGINGIAADKEPAESPLVGSSMMHYDPTETNITKDSDICAAAYSIVESAGTDHPPQIDIVGCAAESKKLGGLPRGTRVWVEVHEDGSVKTRPFDS